MGQSYEGDGSVWFGLVLFGCKLAGFGLHFCLNEEMYELGSTPWGEMQLAWTLPYPRQQIFLEGEWWVPRPAYIYIYTGNRRYFASEINDVCSDETKPSTYLSLPWPLFPTPPNSKLSPNSSDALAKFIPLQRPPPFASKFPTTNKVGDEGE